MKKSVFGTDGVRGIYGKTLTDETAFRLGVALGSRGDVLLGGDNRVSTPALLSALAAGVKAGGGIARSVGLVTTPALYYLLTKREEPFAVMVTASHNPPEHNGLKVFSREGKLGEKDRLSIEEAMAKAEIPLAYEEPKVENEALSRYEDFLLSFAGDLSGVSVLIDLAGGAGYAFRDLLQKTGATVFVRNARHTGEKINENCGALFPSVLRKEVLAVRADLGFALDGDGDRIVAANGKGEILDGDKILYLLACRMKERGKLKRHKVALTVMTNSGVLESLSEKGIEAVCSAVGDAAVVETMRAEGLNLGGEQSGHIVLGDLLMTGDALLVGIALMKIQKEEGRLPDPSVTIYPQVLLNVPVRDKTAALSSKVRETAEKIKGAFEKGRVLVRASGTENLIRVMTEHPSFERAESAAKEIARVIEEEDKKKV